MSGGSVSNVILGGVQIALSSAFDLSQSYSVLGGDQLLRMLDGSGVKQQQWNKIATTITGNGALPVGLDEIDFSLALVLSCGAPRGVTSTSTTIVLPPGRRSDPGFEETGFALVGNDWVSTSIGIVIDTVTLVNPGGATAFRVEYFPEITVFARPPDIGDAVRGREFTWTINAEEI